MRKKPDFISTADAASIIGVTDSAVRAMLSRGVFPGAFKLTARSWAIPRSEAIKERDKGQTTGYPRGRSRDLSADAS